MQKFSLKHDCTNALLQRVCELNQWTLKCIDIECSKQVNDDSVPSILLCANTVQLSLFGTGISDEGVGKLIANLPSLSQLPRGDFLCDALAWIDEDEDGQDPIYLIQEFFPSQKYYFHEDWQIEMVAKSCPYISKMFFIFHENCVQDYLILLPFAHLSELDLYGGVFFRDKICELLQVKGQQLLKLTLISVKEMNYKAFAMMTVHCHNLKNLTLNNCDIEDFKPGDDPNSDQEYEKREAYINMAREAHEIVQEFRSLETINITSPVNSLYLVFILSRCPRMKAINLGSINGLTDESMLKIYLKNPLTDLEEFHVESATNLSMMTVNLIVNNCLNIKSISDLQKWPAIDPVDLSKFRDMIRTENYELDTSSNMKIRRYLDLSGRERRTYINLVTGPFLERLRMAERQAQTL